MNTFLDALHSCIPVFMGNKRLVRSSPISGYFIAAAPVLIVCRQIIIVAITILLMGCGSTQPVPVINKSPDREIPDAYRVKQGDSIYNIAWAFGVDYTDIAEWSEIKAPFRLTPGQVVFLRTPQVKTTPLGSESDTAIESQTIVATSLPETLTPKVQPAPPSPSISVDFSSNPGKWNWPAKGKLAGRFSPGTGSNGIQISGVSGSPVKATAAGEVVYAGEGLRGYGKLIILKHSNEFLSAYAHNESLMVKEGQTIRAAQQIATMGNSGTQSTRLHFEIRKGGEPVDPLQYLVSP